LAAKAPLIGSLAAVLVVVVGWGICGMALYAVALGSASVAAASFIVAIAVWVASSGAAPSESFSSFRRRLVFYARNTNRRSPEHRIHTLSARRDQALRRTHDLQTYASFCLRESECWPEDSIDRAELVAYSEVASRLADESLREWRELHRAIRAERFEQITSR
jgi:hypothetical protein